jgi:hypothetical protein
MDMSANAMPRMSKMAEMKAAINQLESVRALPSFEACDDQLDDLMCQQESVERIAPVDSDDDDMVMDLEEKKESSPLRQRQASFE